MLRTRFSREHYRRGRPCFSGSRLHKSVENPSYISTKAPGLMWYSRRKNGNCNITIDAEYLFSRQRYEYGIIASLTNTLSLYIFLSNILDIMRVERVTSLQYLGVGNQE